MSAEELVVYLAGVVLVLVCGLYCLLVTTNLIRTIIGLELLTKAVTVGLVLVGFLTGKTGLAQAVCITLIVVEVVVMVVAAGIIVSAYRRNGSLDLRQLRNIKG